jgi:hypothetical protein
VTDKGQANSSSADDLSAIAPPILGLAEATRIAPERQASSLPSPTDELNNGFSSPSIVVSDHPQSPATMIPSTDGSSTRPTKGGIAYPFSLKVDGEGGKHARNASMMTLDSVDVLTPPAVEVNKELGTTMGAGNEVAHKKQTETLYTAAPGMGSGAGLFSSGMEVEGAEKVVRPPVERFETAMEDLSTLAKRA